VVGDIVDMFNKRAQDNDAVIAIFTSNFQSMMGAPAFLAAETVEIEEWAARLRI